MKKSVIILAYFSITILIASGCSSSKEMSVPASLYKSAEGMEIAWNSYDSVLTLFENEFTEDFVDTDYGRSHLLVSGENDAHPVILVPGLFGDATMWYNNMGELSKHFRVYCLDMPNYGGKNQPYGKAIKDIDDYRIWISHIMDHYDLKNVSLVGISYSSWLALALTREMPETFASIVLLDPSETFMPMNGGIAWKGFKSFMFFPNRNKYAGFLDWLGGGYTDEEFKASAQGSLPHAEVVIVPGCGHGLNMENPGYVNARIIDFLNNN